MQRISVHISEETKQRINLVAKAKRKRESELIREALDVGLDSIYPKLSSAKALVELARRAKGVSFEPKEPTDVSLDTARYAFGGNGE